MAAREEVAGVRSWAGHCEGGSAASRLSHRRVSRSHNLGCGGSEVTSCQWAQWRVFLFLSISSSSSASSYLVKHHFQFCSRTFHH